MQLCKVGVQRPFAVRAKHVAVPGQRKLVQARVSPEYGFVMGSVAVSAGIAQYLAINVALARRECNVPYPTMYANGDDDLSKKFNCVQRSHQNMLETLPLVVAMQMLLGLVHPITAAGMGMVWNLGRILYAQGYSTGDPSKRGPGGIISSLIYLAFIFATFYGGLKVAGVLPA